MPDILSRTVHKEDLAPTDLVVKHFRDNDLRLLKADKEGGFVALSANSFTDKATKAITKNINEVESSALRVRQRLLTCVKNFYFIN